MGQGARFDVFVLSTIQGCGFAESWAVGTRGWGVFPLASAIGGRRVTSSVWRSPVVCAALSGTQEMWCSLFLGFSQHHSASWAVLGGERLPQCQHSDPRCWQRGGRGGMSLERRPGPGLGSAVLPKVLQPFPFPIPIQTHSLIAALESPCIQPLLFGNTQHQGSSAGAGGRGIPWGSGKAQWGFVGHKTPCKPPRAPAAMFRAVTN